MATSNKKKLLNKEVTGNCPLMVLDISKPETRSRITLIMLRLIYKGTRRVTIALAAVLLILGVALSVSAQQIQ